MVQLIQFTLLHCGPTVQTEMSSDRCNSLYDMSTSFRCDGRLEDMSEDSNSTPWSKVHLSLHVFASYLQIFKMP